jgi:hypothetical protein
MKHLKTRTPFFILAVFILLPAFSFIYGGPVIEVDKPDFDAGSIRREERQIIRHLFKIKNSGDDTLKISRVKPG